MAGFSSLARRLALAGVVLATVPPCARAQDGAPSPPPIATDSLKIERITESFAAAPDVRFGKVNGRQATFAGAYGGWMVDKAVLVGGGGYWLTNRHHDFEMQYGGAVLEWLARADQRIGFGTRALVGGGTARISRPFGEIYGTPIDPEPALRDARFGHGHGPGHVEAPRTATITSTTPVIVSSAYFVFEPQANLLIEITPWLRFNAGVGYRAIGGAGPVNDRLGGASGSVALQVGGN